MAPASEAPASAEASAAAGGGLTVDAKPVGAAGTVLVAGANGMTVDTFTKDVKDSGKSNCTAGCIAKWPALTVATGATPTGGTSLTGKLGTCHPGRRHVFEATYNGMPLDFFATDKAPGDANGIDETGKPFKPDGTGSIDGFRPSGLSGRAFQRPGMLP